jgi:hypothetical protein
MSEFENITMLFAVSDLQLKRADEYSGQSTPR